MTPRRVKLLDGGIATVLPREYFRLLIRHPQGAELRARGEFDSLLNLYKQLDALGYRIVSILPEQTEI